jgi:hypothetical protein
MIKNKENDYGIKNIWDSLNEAAKINLSNYNFLKFIEYKKKLIKDGHEWENDAVNILSGFIWECLESEETGE